MHINGLLEDLVLLLSRCARGLPKDLARVIMAYLPTVLLKGNIANARNFFDDLRVRNELRVCVSGMRTCLDFRLP